MNYDTIYTLSTGKLINLNNMYKKKSKISLPETKNIFSLITNCRYINSKRQI